MSAPRSALEIAGVLLMVALKQHLKPPFTPTGTENKSMGTEHLNIILLLPLEVDEFQIPEVKTRLNSNKKKGQLKRKSRKEEKKRLAECRCILRLRFDDAQSALFALSHVNPIHGQAPGTYTPPVGLHNESPFSKWDLLLHFNSPSDQIRPATEKRQ